MLEIKDCFISGLSWGRDLLWIAAPEERLAVTYRFATGKAETMFAYRYEVWDICPDQGGVWIIAGGGRLGRQLVLWSLEEGREIRNFSCPDGAGAGMTLFEAKLWLCHRHNRKLFCLDPHSGKVNWVIRTENETFSPASYNNELWLIESDPGPLGHWSESQQAKFFFSRYDPVRERIVERLPVPFIPVCMAFDGERFWYAEEGKRGVFSINKP